MAALRALASRDLRLGKVSGLDELADVLVTGAAESLDSETANLLAWALETSAPRAAAAAHRLSAKVDAGAEYRPITPAAIAAGRVLVPLIDDSLLKRIDLLAEVPAEWFGRPVDVRGFGTFWGPHIVQRALARSSPGAALGTSR